MESAPSVIDLGELKGNILLFGGPYSNFQATQALIAEAERRDIPKSHRICTGDVVAYCAEPLATWDLVSRECAAIVAGNCEKQIASGEDACGCGFEDGSVCDLASKEWFPHASAQMIDRRLACAACPDFVVFRHNDRRCAVVHGGATDVARFLWSTTREEDLRIEIRALRQVVGPIDVVIAGHSGLAFQREVDGVAWVNAGVIGMPPHDGRQNTEFAVLTDAGIVFDHLSYDAKAASDAMRQAGLTQGYEAALLSGIWPSEDVLPLELRR